MHHIGKFFYLTAVIYKYPKSFEMKMSSGLRHQLENLDIGHIYLEFVLSLRFFFVKIDMKAWGMLCLKPGEETAKKTNNKENLNIVTLY